MARFQSERTRHVGQVLLLGTAYVAIARSGLAGIPLGPEIPLFWPNAGLTIAALLLLGPGLWPGVLLGSFLAALAVGASPPSLFLAPVGSTLAAFLAATLLRRTDRQTNRRQTLSGLATFAALGVIIPAAIGATLNTGALVLTQSPTSATIVEIWGIWWLGEASAIVLLVPLLVAWRDAATPAYSPSQRLEAILLFLLVAIISFAVFILGTAPLEAIYLLFPFLSWVALRFSVREAAAAACLTGVIAHLGAVAGTSPLGKVAHGYGHPVTWVYTLIAGSLALLLAAAMEQRKQAHSALSSFLDGANRDDTGEGVQGQQALPALHDVHSARRFAVMAMVIVTTPLFLILYEWSSGVLLARWPRWLAYVVTAVVGSTVAAIVAYITLSRQSDLYERIVDEILARQQVEEMREELSRQTERLRRSAALLEAEVAERKQTETALRQSEERNRALVQAMPDLMFLLDEAGTFLDYHDADHDLFFPPEKFVGRRLDELFPDEFSDPLQELIRETRRTGEVQVHEYSLETDGIPRHYEARLAPCGDDQILAIVRDITDRKSAEQGLLKEKLFSETMIETLPGLLALIDSQGRLQLWNKNFEHFTGYTADQLVQLPAIQVVHPDDHDLVREHVAGIMTEGWTSLELNLLDGEGDRTPFFITARKLIVEGEPHMLGIALDISGRKQAEQALRESEQRYRLLFRHSPLGILHFDATGTIVDCNEKFVKIIGSTRGDLLGLNMLESVEDEGILEAIRRALRGEITFYEDEYHSLTADKVTPVRAVFGPVSTGEKKSLGGVGIVEDVTERRRTEAALQRKQKLESLGVLAGGIAHDFNNLLVAMLGQASLALSRLAPESAARTNVEKMVTAAERAADLTRQLLAYSGQGQFQRRPIQLNSLIAENLHLFKVAIHRQIKLEANLDDSLPLVEADAGQMQQVIMNLILNAAEAIGDGTGTVTVTTVTADVGGDTQQMWLHGSDELQPGCYAVVGVHDDGCGMDEATLSKIFDPFFTTKFSGRGLGLAAVLGIVRGHKGGLRVDSRPGEGTSFHIYLPAFAEDDPAGPGPEKALTEGRDGYGPILVIDDEEAVCDAVSDIMSLEGVNTFVACDGPSGLALYLERAEEIKLVVLDLSMPGMGGLQVLQALREIDADVPVLLSSGYAEPEIVSELDHMPNVGFIQKPYSAQSLVKALDNFHDSTG